MAELINKDGLTEAEFLSRYDAGKYERPSVTVDMLIFRVDAEEVKVLLVRRGDHPCIGQLALPGGFVNMDESLEDAARRELMEETNLSDVYLEQLYTFGDLGRDPRTRTISTAYLAVLNGDIPEVRAGDDAAEAKWFSIVAKRGYAYENRGQAASVENVVLQLQYGQLSLQAELEVKNSLIGKLPRTERRIISSGGIAFDHAKIILHGLDRIQELGIIR